MQHDGRQIGASALAAAAACVLGFALSPPVRAAAADFAFHQPYIVDVLDEKSVSSGVVTALAFEQNGLLWIGSQNGLLRYDGYATLKFGHQTGDDASLAGDYVRALAFDSAQRLWVATQSDGVSVIDTRTMRITNHRHQPQDSASLGSGTVFALATAADGEVHVGSDDGLSRQRTGEVGFRHDRHDPADPNSLGDDRVRSLLFARNGDLWVGTASGLALRSVGTSGYVPVAADGDDARTLRGKEIRSLFEASDGRVWIGTRQHGAAVVQPDGSNLRWIEGDAAAPAMPHAWVYTIAQPRPEQVWLGTAGGGIAVVDAASLRITRVIRHQDDGASIKHNLVSALAPDRSGLLWIGTWGGGLQRTTAAHAAFRMVRKPVLSEADVHSVLELRDGRILVGTFSNGIDILDRKRGAIGAFRPGSGPMDLPNGIVIAMAESPDGSIWVGTQQGGVLQLAPGSDRWQRYDQTAGLPSALVHSVLADTRGGLWAGTAAGLARFDAASKRFSGVRESDGGIHGTRVVRMAEDRRGRLWLATDDGLGLYEPEAALLRHVRHVAGQADSLSSNDVNGVLVDGKDRLWVDTAEGLNLLLREDGDRFEFDHVSDRFGRVGQSVGGNLVEDASGRIWTDSYVHDPGSTRIDAFDQADGIDLGTHWTGSVAATRDGLLLFGGTLGLAVVDPAEYTPWTFAPAVVATELRVDGIARDIAPLAAAITLQPHEHNFNVSFAALDLSEPMANRYAYRLLGSDADWIETTASHRMASYGNLWPGRYTLDVRGSNRNQDWSPHLLSIPITVLPQFWQTSAFLAVLVIALLATVYAGYRWQLRVVVARARHLEQLVAARTSELEAKNAALATAYAQVEQAAVTDPLTGLGNRRSITALINSADPMRRVKRRQACILADIDRFKSINDQHGHAAGDTVLCAIANLLRNSVREGDALARWGGEEFLVVADVTDMPDAWRYAERLRLAVENTPVDLGSGRQLPCTCSIGIALLAPPDTTAPLRFEAFVAIADAALYRAKRSGRNRSIGLEITGTIPRELESRLRDDPEQMIADGLLREWVE